MKTKFQETGIYSGDASVPIETVVYISKLRSILTFVIGAALCCCDVYVFLASQIVVGVVLLVPSAALLFSGLKGLRNNIPQIILNAKGIQTVNTPFYEWPLIKNEMVYHKSRGRAHYNYFAYTHPLGTEEIEISFLKIGKRELIRRVHVYRARSEEKLGY
jgi:hypothetical protein